MFVNIVNCFCFRFFPNRTLLGTGISIGLSTFALFLFVVTSAWGLAVNSVCMFLAGAFNAGPDTLLGESSQRDTLRSILELMGLPDKDIH